jgi:hypothetical protein
MSGQSHGGERQRTVDRSMGQDYFGLRVRDDHFSGKEDARDIWRH